METTIRAGGDSLGAQSPSATQVHNVLAIIANTKANTYICGAFRCHHGHLKADIHDVKCYAFIHARNLAHFKADKDDGTASLVWNGLRFCVSRIPRVWSCLFVYGLARASLQIGVGSTLLFICRSRGQDGILTTI